MKLTSCRFFLALTILFCSFTIVAKQLSYAPHTYLSGFTGTNVTGEVDVLAPVWLRTKQNLFVYAHGRYGYEKPSWANNSWTGSFGLGYRQIADLFGYSSVLGAYTLGEYTRTPDDHSVWIINPGLESLGATYDIRINGYFPVSHRDWTTWEWADKVGDYSYVHFSGHTMYNAKYIYHEESGPGGDVEFGRKLFTCHGTLVKGYLDGYYFYMQHNSDILGGGGRITIQPNTYLEFSLNDVYDKHTHNVFMAGIRVSLYDLFSHDDKQIDSNDLQRRLFDPLERNFAQLGSGSDLRVTGGPPGEDGGGDNGKAEPAEIAHGHSPGFVELANVWFFKGGVAANSGAANGATITYDDGTFEHPFSGPDLNNTILKEIEEVSQTKGFNFSNLFLQGGHDYAQAINLTLLAQQSIYGRSADFVMPAAGAFRPLLHGQLTLDGGSAANMQNVNNIRLENEGSAVQGIEVDGKANIAIDNVKIGVSTISGSANYDTGIDVKAGGNVNGGIANSTIYAAKTGGAARGLYVSNSSIGNITDNTISVAGKSGVGVRIRRILSGITSVGNISGNSIQAVATGSGSKAYGIRINSNAGGAATITVGDISNNIAINGFAADDAYGIWVRSRDNVSIGNISGNTSIKAESSGSGTKTISVGIYLNAGDSGSLNIANIYSNNIIAANTGPGSLATRGLWILAVEAPITIGNIGGEGALKNTIKTQGTAGLVFGIWNTGGGGIIGNLGSIIADNTWIGMSIPNRYGT